MITRQIVVLSRHVVAVAVVPVAAPCRLPAVVVSLSRRRAVARRWRRAVRPSCGPDRPWLNSLPATVNPTARPVSAAGPGACRLPLPCVSDGDSSIRSRSARSTRCAAGIARHSALECYRAARPAGEPNACGPAPSGSGCRSSSRRWPHGGSIASWHGARVIDVVPQARAL